MEEVDDKKAYHTQSYSFPKRPALNRKTNAKINSCQYQFKNYLFFIHCKITIDNKGNQAINELYHKAY